MVNLANIFDGAIGQPDKEPVKKGRKIRPVLTTPITRPVDKSREEYLVDKGRHLTGAEFIQRKLELEKQAGINPSENFYNYDLFDIDHNKVLSSI